MDEVGCEREVTRETVVVLVAEISSGRLAAV